MSHLHYSANLDVLRRYGTAAAVILSCLQCLAHDQAFGPRELASVVKPCLPCGWSISVKGEEVILERGERIEIYNSIALPGINQQEEIQRRLREFTLSIRLRVDKPMEQQEYERIKRENETAYEKAAKEAGRIKFMPGSGFWRDHPQYNSRVLPSFDLGHHCVVMTCQPEFVVFVGRDPNSRYLWMFRDAMVEAECQGMIDDLGKLWRTYVRDADISP